MIQFFMMLSVAVGFSAAALAKDHHVTMSAIKYVPEILEIKKGDTVIWKNDDIVPHTVTSEMPKLKFDSGAISPGGEFKLTVKQSGEVVYKCLFHPMMKGKLIAK
jgi:plastocyanin